MASPAKRSPSSRSKDLNSQGVINEIEELLKEVESDEEGLDNQDLNEDLNLEDILNEEISDALLNQGDELSIYDDLQPQLNDQQLLDQLFPERPKSQKNLLQKDSTKKNHIANISCKSGLEIAEAREKQLLSLSNIDVVSPLQVKRRLRSSLPKSRATAKVEQNSISSAVDEINKKNKAGVIKVESMETISTQLKKNMEFKHNGPGSPTAIGIHSKFIAIGTSKGLVIVFDHFQNVRQVLGNAADSENDGPVTAIDVSPASVFLVCGYQSGRIVLWDLIKGTALKAVSESHESPVVSLRFWKQEKANVISVDSNGIVNKISFSKMMGYLYVVDTDLILDGAAGKIPSIAVLPHLLNNAKASQIMDQYSLVALSSDKVTFIVALEPEVKVLFRWQQPRDLEEAAVLPSLAFSWVSMTGCTSVPAAVLARGWGNNLQFVEVIFPGGASHKHSQHGWPVFEEREKIICNNGVLAVEWIGEHVFVYLNSMDELYVHDSMSLRELEVVDVKALELVYATFRGKFKGEEYARSFSNSFRGCDDNLYLLGLKELQLAKVQSWTQRTDALVESGEWLEALALTLEHYDGLKTAALERAERNRFAPVFLRDKRNDQCVVDIFRMCQTNQRTGDKQDVYRQEDGDKITWHCGDMTYPEETCKRLETAFQNARGGGSDIIIPISVIDRMSELLMDYVRLAIANAPSSISINIGAHLDLSKSHYQMLAGLCIEYCSTIGRSDLLFGDIYSRFRECGKSNIFVELLEPYILTRQLKFMAPEAMQEFVDNHTKKKMLSKVEQCILHLDVKKLDYDSVIKLCIKYQLFSALIFVYTEGLNDYTTPIGILLDACGNVDYSRHLKPLYDEEMETRKKRLLGYKLLLYISYCFKGKRFPDGGNVLSDELSGIRSQICHYLFEEDKENSKIRSLILIDAKEFLNIIAALFDSPDVEFEEKMKTNKFSSSKSKKCPSRQLMILSLVQVIVGPPGSDPSTIRTFSSSTKAELYMFEARLLTSGAIDAEEYASARSGSQKSTWMMDSLMRFLAVGSIHGTSSSNSDHLHEKNIDKTGRQSMLIRLINKLSTESYDQNALLKYVNREKMNRAAMLIFKSRGDFSQTIASYLEDSEHDYQINVFVYIRTETEKIEGDEEKVREEDKALRTKIEEGIIEHTPQLLDLDSYAFVVLILELFPGLNNQIIHRLMSMDEKDAHRLEFVYLNEILAPFGKSIEGEKAEMILELLDRTKLKMGDDPVVQERYIGLLCQFEPKNVFSYLETQKDYSLDKCLALCQKHRITDAEAYLLERTGDVKGALKLILKYISKKLAILEPKLLRGHKSKTINKQHGGWQNQQESMLNSINEGVDVMNTLDIAIAICQRNSVRDKDEQSESLWFMLMDMFLKHQTKVKTSGKTTSRGAQSPMQVALNQFIRVILERMSAHVSLKSILFKITNEYGKGEFGDFKYTISGMFSTYGYEENIFTTANGLIKNDLYEQIHRFHQAQRKRYAPASNVCNYCHVPVGKPPFGMGNSSGNKWSRLSSMTMVLATGHIFHESCGKLWQEENDKKPKDKKEKKRRKNENESEEKLVDNNNLDINLKANKQQNTRLYLNRLKRARKKQQAEVTLLQILGSLSEETTHRNQLLKSGTFFNLIPNPSNLKKKRVGPRQPGSLPLQPNQKGSLRKPMG